MYLWNVSMYLWILWIIYNLHLHIRSKVCIHLEPWCTWFQVWFHDILHIHEFINEFIGHEMSHMNSWSWNLIWIHYMNSDMNSWSWRISWNHMSEFICMNSSLNSCWWIHDNEIIYEFICMNSCVNSVLWIISWNHGWIFGNEFTYEIMVEFINLKLFLIQLQISFSEGKRFTHPT